MGITNGMNKEDGWKRTLFIDFVYNFNRDRANKKIGLFSVGKVSVEAVAKVSTKYLKL